MLANVPLAPPVEAFAVKVTVTPAIGGLIVTENGTGNCWPGTTV